MKKGEAEEKRDVGAGFTKEEQDIHFKRVFIGKQEHSNQKKTVHNKGCGSALEEDTAKSAPQEKAQEGTRRRGHKHRNGTVNTMKYITGQRKFANGLPKMKRGRGSGQLALERERWEKRDQTKKTALPKCVAA